MNVSIIGYGKMGKAIAEILEERGHTIIAKFGAKGMDESLLKQSDVAIEFSNPEVAFKNISKCFNNGIPVVSGTTGWLNRYEEAIALCKANEGGFLYASNFSLGVNIFFEINNKLANLMASQMQYDISIDETHHTEKKDAPSGTAITLAEQIIDKMERKSSWTMEDDRESSVKINAFREAHVPGTHLIRYSSEIDSIEIKHTAHTRKGFAFGAVLAAEFLAGKTGVYTMKHVLNIN